ncbi:transmembrane protein [Ceratobasidium sp. AG-Ba]|nr:transmembrane protein [Ceratobasidium sp. AG-Ba]
MAHVMLPSSKKAIPKTNAQRDKETVSIHEDEKTTGSEVNPEGGEKATNQPEPVPETKSEGQQFIEKMMSQSEKTDLLGKEAEVWKRYVKDSDQSDKEMVEGRNSTPPDQLAGCAAYHCFWYKLKACAKAALFSAISTAFIIESLGDLKPDPAESSAQTLLVMSQTLTAIANNQPVSLPAPEEASYNQFSPPRSAVVVNILWLLSLSLSVAVSLIAMLAKDWCYKFMSNRVGPMYAQARKRHQKWNGMVAWHMEEVLAFLPWMLHMALLLFAIGLCIYLLDINTSVGLPVTVVTGLVTCLYGCTTVLPMIDGSCPYGTPITAPMTKAFKPLATKTRFVGRSLNFCMKAVHRISQPKWWRSHPESHPNDASYDIQVPGDNAPLRIDLTTSQMLAWMIQNCEDPKSVEVALQAIGDARYDLPPKPLLECKGLELVLARLKAYANSHKNSKMALLNEQSTVVAVNKYCRAYAILQSGSTGLALYGANVFRGLSTHQVEDRLRKIKDVYTELSQFWGRKQCEIDNRTSALIMLQQWKQDPRCWNLDNDTWASDSSTTPDSKNSCTVIGANATGNIAMTSEDLLNENTKIDESRPSASRLLVLLRMSAQYLVVCWANDVPQKQKQCPLPAMLVRIFFEIRASEPIISNMIAVIMAATALAVDSCPVYRIFREMADTPQGRALRMLESYQAGDFRENTTDDLFLFGIFGLLPRITVLSKDESNLSALILQKHCSEVYALAMKFHSYSLRTSNIEGSLQFILPPHLWRAARHLLNLAQTTYLTEEDEQRIFHGLSILPPYLLPSDIDLYGETLVALNRTRSKVLHKMFIQLVESQHLSWRYPISGFGLGQRNNVLHRVCRTLPDALDSNARVVLPHLRFIVTDIMLCPYNTLEKRRDALRPLLSSHTEYSSIQPSGSGISPLTVDIVASHVKVLGPTELVSDGVRQTMQLIAGFCGSDLDPQFPAEERNWSHPEVDEWEGRRSRLWDGLKRPVVSAESEDAEVMNRAPIVASNMSAGTEAEVHEDRGNVRLSDGSPV